MPNLFPQEITDGVAQAGAAYAAGFYATTADMDLYVATTGSDVTGDGTAGSPYATVSRAYEDVPLHVNHAVHIHIAAGAYTDWPVNIAPVIGPAGSLVFDGSLAMQAISGSLTIDAGGWSVLLTNIAAEITVVGGGLTPNAYRNKYIRYTSGAAAGTLAPILENSATVVRVSAYGIAPAPGDAFEIVEPGVEVTVSHDVVICDRKQGGYAGIGVYGITLLPAAWEMLVTEGPSEKLWLTGIGFYGSIIGLYTSCRGGISGLATLPVDVTAWGTWGTGATICTDALEGYDIRLVGVQVGYIFASGQCMFRNVAVDNPSDHAFYLDNLSNGSIMVAIYAKPKTNKVGVSLHANSSVRIDGAYIQCGTHGVRLDCGAFAQITGLIGVDTNITTAGISVGQGARVVAKNCTLEKSVGNVQIVWATGAAASSYPAANNMVTDALGAQVVGF